MLLSCGDALIDFLPATTADGRAALMPMVGGACLNIAVGMARLGAPAGFVGGISTDLFGRMIADHASASGVDLRFATRSARQTTLAFVSTVNGQPRYAFYDEQTASRAWTYQSRAIPFAEIDAIHIGSTTIVDATGAEQAVALVGDARGATTISFDPNCRPNLVKDKARYAADMDAFANRADIVKMSDVDFDFLYGGDNYDRIASRLLSTGTSLVVVTRGDEGALAWHKGVGCIDLEAQRVAVVDTIGAGDSFQAALLFGLRTIGRIKVRELAEITSDELNRVLSFASACAAITCGRAAANPPHRIEVGPQLAKLARKTGF
jgi:fructokinase